MSEEISYVECVWLLVVEHGGFPVAEGVEVDLSDSIVFEFVCYVSSLASEVSGEVSVAAGEGFLFLAGACQYCQGEQR